MEVTLAVSVTQSEAITLVTVSLFAQELTAFCDHQTLEHYLQYVMKTIFFLGMLAHYLRKLFLCKTNHMSVFLKLNILCSWDL